LKTDLPYYFHEWINLKSLFKQHFGWEPHGGLQNVVERCGYSFDGRAHSGLVDSRNTAKIVKKMLEEGFRFTRATRNIHAYAPRWHDMTWHDMTWHDMTWHDMTWHDMTW
jgi:inhibitor of KinA sporulation pathway (predicted exonuclease)